MLFTKHATLNPDPDPDPDPEEHRAGEHRAGEHRGRERGQVSASALGG